MKQSTSNMGATAANREAEYAKAVFERLRETLDVVLMDSGTLPLSDVAIQPNYDIRDNGVWLRDGQVRLFDWTPVCDLEEGYGSPDPLTTPALPFPFTARQLAAFMLDGWGWFLAERFVGEDGEVDAEVVKMLLGGARDAKPREAITAAFAALSAARKRVGEPDRELDKAECEAKAAYQQKHDEAEQLHNWREAGITESERDARVQRRNEAVTTEKADLERAMEANQTAHAKWRRKMVRWLLDDACQAEDEAPDNRRIRFARWREAGMSGFDMAKADGTGISVTRANQLAREGAVILYEKAAQSQTLAGQLMSAGVAVKKRKKQA